MTGVVCHYGKVQPNSLLASGRIATLLAARYGFALVDTPDAGAAALAAGPCYDYCIVVSSASGFADPHLRETVGELAARAGRFIFVQNDYMTQVAGQVGTWHKRLGKNYRRTVWPAIPHMLKAERAAPESVHVNWNMLTYAPERAVAVDQRILNMETENMTGVVCHYWKCDPRGMPATVRITEHLVKRYGFDKVHDAESMRAHAGKKYDYCIIVNSAANYADDEIRRGIAELAEGAKHFILVQNDYMCSVHTGDTGVVFRSAGREPMKYMWSTIPKLLQSKNTIQAGSQSVNWNMLTYAPGRAGAPTRQPSALFYYGAHRRDRAAYFQRWLNSDAYASRISTSTRVYKKWQETLGTAPRYTLQPQMVDCIAEMRGLGTVGLYAEDAYSHKVYCSPANRFYEMLSAGVPMVFDRSTLSTFQQAGYEQQMRPYMPALSGENRDELVLRMLSEPEEYAAQQQRLWARDYGDELEAQIRKAESKVGLHAVN